MEYIFVFEGSVAKKRFLRQAYITNKGVRGACIYMKEIYMESHRFSIELSGDFSLYSAIWPLFSCSPLK